MKIVTDFPFFSGVVVLVCGIVLAAAASLT
jgi:hypothetical protein